MDAVRERFGYDAIRLGATGTTRWLEQKGADHDLPARKGPEPPSGEPDPE
jgi:hypothetical protein